MGLNIFSKLNSQPFGQQSTQAFLGGQQPAPVTPKRSMYDLPTPPPEAKQMFEAMGATKPKPIEQKAPMTFFVDEQPVFNQMLADGLPEEEAISLVKKRRADLLEGNTKLNPVEVASLKQMQADGVGADEASQLLKQYRTESGAKKKAEFEKKYEEGNILQKGAYNLLMGATGNLETLAKYGGNLLDFATFGQAGFGEDVKDIQNITKSPEFDSTARTVGSYLPDVALAVSPIGGGYLAGAKGTAGLVGRGAVVGAGFGATQPILEKGSEVTIGDIAKGGIKGGIIGGAIPLAGKTIEKTGGLVSGAGKALYKTAIKPNVQEAERIISSEARKISSNPAVKKILANKKLSEATKAKRIEGILGKTPVLRSDTALKYGITGTEKGIGIKGKAESSKLWNSKIAPAIEKSKAEHNIDDMFVKAEKIIQGEKSALRKQELMDGLQALKEDYLATGKNIFTTGDLQAEKSMLDQFTPTKIWKGKEVAQGYSQAKNTLANIFREQVRDDLGKAGLTNAKELYADYANLSALEDIGIKGITEGGLKGGFGTFWSTIYDKLATPVKTVGGKYIYKLGNGIEYVGPKGMDTLGKYLKSKGYKVVGGNIINLSKNANAPLIRGTILSSDTNTGMDMNPVK